MLRHSIIALLLGHCLLPREGEAFGIERALPRIPLVGHASTLELFTHSNFYVMILFYYHLEIPFLIACGLVWTIISSLSAGNVNASSSTTEDEISFDGTAIEETMVLEDGVAKGSLFLSGPKVKTYGESGKESNVGSSATASKAFENINIRKRRT